MRPQSGKNCRMVRTLLRLDQVAYSNGQQDSVYRLRYVIYRFISASMPKGLHRAVFDLFLSVE